MSYYILVLEWIKRMRYNVNWLALDALLGGFCYLWIEPASLFSLAPSLCAKLG